MIRLGVVGYGDRISHIIKVLQQLDANVKVVSIIDPNQTAVAKRISDSKDDYVFRDSISEMVRLDKPDGLLIGTQCNLHAPYAIEAAKYDIPLFLEKPIAISMEQAIAVEDAFSNSKCNVVVSFPLRVSPICRFAKKNIESGMIGTSEHITALNYVPYGICYWELFYRNYEATQGLLVQKATHDLDYISYLMGSDIVRVVALASYGRVFGGEKPAGLKCSMCKETEDCCESPYNRQKYGAVSSDHLCLFSVDCGSREKGMNEDSTSLLIEFASGAHGMYTQVFFSRRDAGIRSAIVSGYHGTINFDFYTGALKYTAHHDLFSNNTKFEITSNHFGGDVELARNFLDVIAGKESCTPIETGLKSIYACLAAKESIKTKGFVSVRQVGKF
jgi:predicted dehydrogenase